MGNRGWEAEQFGADCRRVYGVVVAAHRRVAADLPRRDTQNRVGRRQLGLLGWLGLGFSRHAGALLVQKRGDLVPSCLIADSDIGDDVDQHALAVFAKVLGVHLHPDGVGHRDRPELGDLIVDMYRTHCSEREIETGDQFHHCREGEGERIGQRHGIGVAQSGDRRVVRDVGAIDRQLVDSQRAVGTGCRRAG